MDRLKSFVKIINWALPFMVIGCSSVVFGQDPLLKEWDQRYGGSGDDQFYTLMHTNDGGYLLGGYSLSDRDGDKSEMSRGGNDYWIVKTDASGNKVWDKRYGGNLDDRLYSMAQTPDGGYILAGHSNSDNGGDVTEPCKGGFDYWLIKIDSIIIFFFGHWRVNRKPEFRIG